MTEAPVDIDIEWFWHLGGTEKCFRYVATFADGSKQGLGTQSHDWPEGWAAIERETWWKRCAEATAKRNALVAEPLRSLVNAASPHVGELPAGDALFSDRATDAALERLT